MSSRDYYKQAGIAMTCRSYEEYTRMFTCDFARQSAGPILDAAGGASSFGAEAREKGVTVVSADPLYRLTSEEMEAHGLREMNEATSKLGELKHRFDWSYYGSVEEHERGRRKALAQFTGDYRHLRGTDAYVAAALPELPFAAESFSYVICSHFLFLYAEQLSYDFHLKSILELARVCRSGGAVLIYPLLDFRWNPYAQLEQLMAELGDYGLHPQLRPSRLPFIPGSHQFLFIGK